MNGEPLKVPVRERGWRFYVLVPLMAFLAPLLADSLHSFFVVHIEAVPLFNAELGRIASPRFWILTIIRGGLSFFVILPFAWKTRFWDFGVWVCLVGIWMWIDFEAEYQVH
jgi:hypothetical protein